MKIMYAANVLVAGWIGVLCLFRPSAGWVYVFESRVVYSESLRVTGALWLSIAVISLMGIFYPRAFSVVLLFQLVYKSAWLLVVFLPAIWHQTVDRQPVYMAVFFIVWVIVLPFVIPWKELFR